MNWTCVPRKKINWIDELILNFHGPQRMDAKEFALYCILPFGKGIREKVAKVIEVQLKHAVEMRHKTGVDN